MDKKALKFMIIAAVSIAAIVTAVLFGINTINENNEKQEEMKKEEITVETDTKVSKDDSEMLKIKTSKIFSNLAEFGYQVEPEERNGILVNSESSFVSRQDAYAKITDDVFPYSPLNYSKDATELWNNDFELTYLVSYELKDIEVELDENYSNSNVKGNKNLQSVKGIAKVVSHVTYANDFGSGSPNWDGTYKIYEKDIKNEIQITFVKDTDDEWKIYQARGADKLWVLAYDKDPNTNRYYENLMNSGFNNTGNFKIEVPESQSSDFPRD